jgi:hypothetical protein
VPRPMPRVPPVMRGGAEVEREGGGYWNGEWERGCRVGAHFGWGVGGCGGWQGL